MVTMTFVLVISVLALAVATALDEHEETGTGWQANPEVVADMSRQQPGVLYDEAKVPVYLLPDPLVMSNGGAVTDAQTWRTQRRPEILELFREHVYGRAPVGQPEEMSFHQFDCDSNALEGKATRKQVRIDFMGTSDGPGMDLLMFLPKDAPQPVSLFVLLNFGGNHTVHLDPAIRVTTSWVREGEDHKATESSRGSAMSAYPVEKILDRGYGLATAYYGDIDPDYDDGFQNGVHAAFDCLTDGKRAADAWGAIGAWAWGLSRAVDYLHADPEVNSQQVAVLGHSRLGKTALWAGAQDERFAIVISNNSGCGGAALSRRPFGETVESINRMAPYWFCDNFKRFSGKENDLPVDQHELIALAAPRPVYVASADKDLWADPRGEFLAALGADPVYRLFRTDGLPTMKMPPLDHPVQGTADSGVRIGYHVRTGEHALTEYDWERYMDFADRHWKFRG